MISHPSSFPDLVRTQWLPTWSFLSIRVLFPYNPGSLLFPRLHGNHCVVVHRHRVPPNLGGHQTLGSAGDSSIRAVWSSLTAARPPDATQALGHKGSEVPQSLSVLPLPTPNLLLGGEDGRGGRGGGGRERRTEETETPWGGGVSS